MQSSSVKIGWKVMLVFGLYGLVLSLIQLFLPEGMFAEEFAAFTAESWSDYVASSPKPAELFLITQRIIGGVMFLMSFLVILIAWKSYSRAEKWSWYAFLVTGVLSWGTWLTYYIVIDYLVAIPLVIFIIGAGLFVVGIALPAKAILSGKASKG